MRIHLTTAARVPFLQIEKRADILIDLSHVISDHHLILASALHDCDHAFHVL